jgi:uncharacterized LabA/DUF88 family protein
MADKHYTLENLNEVVLSTMVITVTDRDTGEERTVKTVNRAEVVTIVAYMLGIDEQSLNEYYSQHYGQLLEQLRQDKDATIIRYLSRIRTTIMKNFLQVDNEMRYNLLNIDRISLFEHNEIASLQKWGVRVVQPNYRSDKYISHLTKLMDEHIDACEHWFPETIRFSYLRELFVVPHYSKKDVLKTEYEKFHSNIGLYPFQMYLYWQPEACGNILYSDGKFLKILYSQHGEAFYEDYKYRDASDNTKQSIYDFIRQADRVVMAVDCENADPYKLYGVLKNLSRDDVNQIKKIILYDDYHTTVAWDYIERLLTVPVEHVEVPRVTDSKSLVDIQMAVGVSASYYRDGVDSFILCSSDSDFWGLISAIPDAHFLVMYEYRKCGQAIKEALNGKSIFHCAMDDFYQENAHDLQKIVLKKALESYLPKVVGENGWELTRQIYADAYIETSEKEMRRFYEKYIKTLQLKLDTQGNFYVALSE